MAGVSRYTKSSARAIAASVYCALAQTASCPTAPSATKAWVPTKSSAAVMSAIFRDGSSACRGAPPLSPNPEKSNVKAVYPSAASRSA